ncbi:class C sortase [Bifidobacterium aemilianum]|uniref:Class C sortase n=2 Tax=Bifidobacterium aemilianum TaxID=2493120 RepID=A0A366K9C5_9BIFI|nr:class C sortase [Bifidobacterium aemilianum]
MPVVQYVSYRQQSARAQATAEAVSAWPSARISRQLEAARRYNRDIAASGQETLGEASDPFSPGDGSPTLSQRDKRYQRLLNIGDGVMGSISVPKISVKMPIYHGTSDQALASGAGHLYGTSLPIGGSSTNSVLSGHRGLAGALLFTRLDELQEGDIFYVNTLDHTMGYRIIGIHVIDPEDTHLYAVVPGKDMVTLMTCTPYGVNTHRMIITGTRQPIPHPIPEPSEAPGDAVLKGAKVGFLLLTVGLLLAGIGQEALILPLHTSGLIHGRRSHILVVARRRFLP